MIIYKATNKVNNKSYIGQTIKPLEKRQSEHLRSSIKNSNFAFHRAIRKYGKENFEWKILCECKDIDELNLLEEKYIKEYGTFGKSGYNMNTGGGMSYGYKHTESSREKIGMRYYPTGSAHPNTGKVLSEHTRYLIKKNHAPCSGKDNAFYGKTHTEETKQKLSKMFKGKPSSRAGMPFRVVECPHCGLRGGGPNMTRYHFDNCKHNQL